MRHCWGTTPISGEVGLTARLHPLRRAAPVTWHYTRSERVHCLRIGCNAYGSGALPTDRVQHPQSQEQTRKLRDADLGAVPVGGGRAWPGFEATRRAKLAARTARGRAATHGHTEQPGPHKQTTRHPEIRRGDKHRHQHPTTWRGRDRFPGHGLGALNQRHSAPLSQAAPQSKRHRSGGHVHVILDRGAAGLEAGDGDAERGAGHVVQAHIVEEVDRQRVATVLATHA